MKTTKKILSILLIFALAGAVSSCKLSFKEPTELEKCLSAYKSFLTEYIVDKDKDRFASFTLIYIDDNDIPDTESSPAEFDPKPESQSSVEESDKERS